MEHLHDRFEVKSETLYASTIFYEDGLKKIIISFQPDPFSIHFNMPIVYMWRFEIKYVKN